MKLFFKLIFSLIILIIIAILIFINSKLYFTPDTKVIEGDTLNVETLIQLRTLRQSLDKGADIEMQEIFPEGYMFINALYGLSWCEFASQLNRNSDVYKEAQSEVDYAFRKVSGKNGYSVFDKSLPLPNGAFYNGWCNYLLAKKLELSDVGMKESEIELFKYNCSLIAEVLQEQTYPESYVGRSWPADVFLCVSALSLHDKLFEKKYNALIAQWIQKVKNNLDENNLIPHSAKPFSGKPLESARGASLSLILSLLPEIDSAFAASQFKVYDSLFSEEIFGLPGIREYPKGKEGSGDIDSGPVLFGAGGAATIVGIKTMRTNGNYEKSLALRNTVETLTFSFKTANQKKYVFGALPIADALLPGLRLEWHQRIVISVFTNFIY
jgi:hypothetical protein